MGQLEGAACSIGLKRLPCKGKHLVVDLKDASTMTKVELECNLGFIAGHSPALHFAPHFFPFDLKVLSQLIQDLGFYRSIRDLSCTRNYIPSRPIQTNHRVITLRMDHHFLGGEVGETTSSPMRACVAVRRNCWSGVDEFNCSSRSIQVQVLLTFWHCQRQ